MYIFGDNFKKITGKESQIVKHSRVSLISGWLYLFKIPTTRFLMIIH